MQWLSHCLFCLCIRNIKVETFHQESLRSWHHSHTQFCLSYQLSPFSKEILPLSHILVTSSDYLLSVQKALILSVWDIGVKNFSASLLCPSGYPIVPS